MKPLYRIPTDTRLSLERELEGHFEALRRRNPGIVLDVGAKHAPYRSTISADTYMTLDLDPANEPDICCDVHQIDWASEYFDAVIATEVLEHLREPQQAVGEMYRILKPGGVCLASTRFFYDYHGDPHDYYRFTWDSLRYLFRPFTRVEVHAHGNRIQALWQLITASKRTFGLLSWLNPLVARIHQRETRCPLGFVVWAEK